MYLKAFMFFNREKIKAEDKKKATKKAEDER